MTRLTASMVIDFVGCFIIEVSCKYLFADLEPKEFVKRGWERRVERRRLEEEAKANELELSAAAKKEL
jgi:manganese-transporting P-type ATPase